MKFFIHVGTEKTGSSFLQSLITLGRPNLLAAGISVPQGTQRSEASAAKGQISAGNGEQLASMIYQDSWSEVSKWLDLCVKNALGQNCQRVLISSERLLTPLSMPGRLATFQSMLSESVGSTANYSLILREPVSQAISLYKHRAKSGRTKPFREWISHDYRLPFELNGLRIQVENSGLEINAIGYTRDGTELGQRFFRAWLKVDPPKAILPERVNPSLRLSELEIIRRIAEQDSRLVKLLYQKFLKLSDSQKSIDTEFEAYARAIAAFESAKYNDVWEFWNERLAFDQRYPIPEPEENGNPTEDAPCCSLSESQVQTLTAFFIESRSLNFRLNIFWSSQLRPLLSKIWRTFRLQSTRRAN